MTEEDKKWILHIIRSLKDKNPVHVFGVPNSGSKYNKGWNDALNAVQEFFERYQTETHERIEDSGQSVF